MTLYSNPIWERMSEYAKKYPDRTCIESATGELLIYGELIERVNATALELVRQGFKRGDKAFFLAKPSIDGIVYLLAVLRAGGVVIAADPAMGREVFRSRVALVEPKWLILEPSLYWLRKIPYAEALLRKFGAEIPDIGPKTIAREIKVSAIAHSSVGWEEATSARDDEALIIFTSGTTAMPKGVVHTFASMTATLDLINADLHPSDKDVFYASQIYFLFIALLSGAKAVLPKSHKFSAVTFADDLAKFKITKAYALPAECEDLIAQGMKLPETLSTLMLGSAPVLVGFLRRLEKIVSENTEVLAIYGSTEILPIARVSMKEKLEFKGTGDLLGLPFNGVHARIENGEIVLSGPNLCKGYFGEAPMNEHFTGDIGTIDSEGRIILLGRKKDMIIRGNYNIYPALFESVIEKIPGVKRAALVGRYDEERSDEEIVLAVEKDGNESDDSLRQRLEKELKGGQHSIDMYAQPDRVVFLELPLSGRSRKVDKEKLRTLV